MAKSQQPPYPFPLRNQNVKAATSPSITTEPSIVTPSVKPEPDLDAVDAALKVAAHRHRVAENARQYRVATLAQQIFVAFVINRGTTTSVDDSIKRAIDAAESFDAAIERRLPEANSW